MTPRVATDAPTPLRPRILARIWGGAVLDFLYPPVCPLCHARLGREDAVACHACRAQLSIEPDWRCPRCGGAALGAGPDPGRRCRLCPPPDAHYRGVLSVVGYGPAPARCVHLFKYNRREELGGLMARLMVDRLVPVLTALGGRLDLVAPVPLHWVRRLGRGFNQSELLARPLATALDLPLETRLLRRRRFTRRQALVPRDRRAANVHDAFSLAGHRNLSRLGVLLVDDVVTTGHTIDECARVLKEAGAREVWIASFARAGMGRPGEED